MGPIYLLFPGQGSQYPGMAKKFQNSASWELWQRADQILGFELSQLCLEASAEQLKSTAITQPAILTHSLASYQVLRNKFPKLEDNITAVLGHSVGEYAALVVAGSLSFDDALKAVHARGQIMQEAVPKGIGAMTALMRAPQELVQRACSLATEATGKIVVPANYNSFDQIVISGENKAIQWAVDWLKQQKDAPRLRTLPLAVSAPFHSPLMEAAAEKLGQTLQRFSFNPTKIDYIANFNARLYPRGTSGQKVRQNLIQQVADSVRWSQSIQQLNDQAISLEVGPGKVLSGLTRKAKPGHEIVTSDADQEILQVKLQQYLGEES